MLLGLTGAVEVGQRRIYSWRGELPPVASKSQVYEWKWARAHPAAGKATFHDSLHVFDERTGWRLRPGYVLLTARRTLARTGRSPSG